MSRHLVSLLFTFVCFALVDICDAEVLHSWVEANPNHAFQNGDIVEYPFNTYTSKSASRSESDGSWQLTASAMASANCQPSSPAPGDLSRVWEVDAQLRATGDLDTLKTEPPDGLSKMEQGVEKVKKSSDGTTTARRKRKGHSVYYKNKVKGPVERRHLDASTSGGKSETSSSSTDLDADPWAKSWLEVRRQINLNEQVRGSPFTSETPDCESSGNGHTCAGATPPPQRRDIVYCRRGEACKDKPGVKGNREAHKIKCPNRTYKQGAWAWLLIKLKEDCKGEKWSCHSDPTNCTRRHLHLNPPASNGTVINGIFVPSGYSVGVCGEHLYASGSASDHAEKTGACGHTYYACLQGDHDQLQASCSTDTNCISTNFYLCNHNSHTYLSQQPCGHRYNPGSSSAHSHRSVPHPCGRHSYYACQTLSSSETNRHTYQTLPCGDHRYYPCRVLPKHKRAITCPRDSNGQSCSHGTYYACSPHTHSYPSANNNNNNGNSGNGNSGNSNNGNSGNSNNGNSQSNTVTCASGHTYKTTGKWATYSANYHRVRTCRYSGCGQSWQACVDGWTAPLCNNPSRKRKGLRCWAQ